jgi:hypothetical protein
MCILVAQGKLPRPDAVIAADTGREMPRTWEYADKHMRPLLATVGLELHVAPHSLVTRDLYATNGDLLIPVFTETGKFQTYCSDEWKARVVQRYARTIGIGTDNDVWIGFSLDEVKRIKGTDNRRFPLIDLMLTGEDCRSIVLAAGLPLPMKSRCWMCPNQHNAEWREVRADPELWRQAIELDDEIRANDDRGGVYLHASRKPLAEADIDTTDRAEPNRQCAFGMCFV